MITTKANNVDEYIADFPKKIQNVLKQIRKTIRTAAPEAEEKISYAMPTFFLKGNLVHFAAFRNHIGFYSVPSGNQAFREELSVYKGAKGSVQFPLDQSMPLDLISKIVKFRVKENLEMAKKKKTLRTCKNGHKYYKSSDCPTCPVCEKYKKPEEGILSLLSAPARRALENNNIVSVQQLSELSEKEILSFHGLGKTSIPILKEVLAKNGLKFKGN